MPVNLSLANVPDDLASRLRKRAERNHRALQAEILAILEEAVPSEKLSPREVLDRARARGIESPSESTRMIREMRDSR